MKQFDPFVCKTTVALGILAGLSFALTSGPSMPEYNNFEPVDATDMVNLPTGNFNWSLPVMTVPGPGLGFPIVLNYHAGIGQKDEASWVGLGWNLQAGAISRQVNKLPDDASGEAIGEYVSSSKIHGWTASVNYNGATIGIDVRNGEATGGYVGIDVGLFSSNTTGFGASAGITVGVGSSYGRTGVSADFGFSTRQQNEGFGVGEGASLSIGASIGSGANVGAGAGMSLAHIDAKNPSAASSVGLMSVGASLSQFGGLSIGASGGLAQSQITVKPKSSISSSGGAVVPLFIPGYGFITFKYSGYTATIDGSQNDNYYGFLYSDNLGMGCTGASGSHNCHGWDQLYGRRKRQEFLGADLPISYSSEAKLMRTSEDMYVVAAQGISGTFKPFRKEDGDYMNTMDNTTKYVCSWDFWNGCGDRTQDRTKQLEKYRNLLNSRSYPKMWDEEFEEEWLSDIYWRFLDDPGGAEYTDAAYLSRNNTATVRVRSRKIVPKFTNNKITGFDITNSDGVTYSFDFPLNNYWEEKVAYHSEGTVYTTRQTHSITYAYAWLLTAIKSVDYVDKGGDGQTNDDIGGWVKFTYGDGKGTTGRKPIQYWGTPYYDHEDPDFSHADPTKAKYGPASFTLASRPKDGVAYALSRNTAYGMKEIAYLQSIETPTHKADFLTAERFDNKPFNLPGTTWQRSIFSQTTKWQGAITFAGPPHSSQNQRPMDKFDLEIKVDPGVRLDPRSPELELQANDPIDVTVDFKFKLEYGSANSSGYCNTYLYSRSPDIVSYTFKNMKVLDLKKVTLQTKDYNLEGFLQNHSCGIVIGDETRIVDVKIFPRKPALNESRALQSIVLKRKNQEATEISSVRLTTDYSLSPYTPNSVANGPNPRSGRLTLKKVEVGAGSGGPYLPPYSFSYSNNPAYQEPLVVNNQSRKYPFERGRWDRWGNLCTDCDDTYHEPTVPFKNDRLDAGAWSLDGIKFPSGGEIKVRYDGKRYSKVGRDPILKQINQTEGEILVASGGPAFIREHGSGTSGEEVDQYLYHVGTANMRRAMAERGLVFKGYRLDLKIPDNAPLYQVFDRIAVGATKQRVSVINQEPGEFMRFSTNNCWDDIPEGLECGKLHSEDFDWPIAYNGPITIPLPESGFWIGLRLQIENRKTRIEYKVYAVYNLPSEGENFEYFGPGVVAKETSFREPFSNKVHTVSFEYENGTTPSMPATFSDFDDSREVEGRGVELYAGSPQVVYGKVTARIPGQGKSVYHFLTPNELNPIISEPSATTTLSDGTKIQTVTVSDLTTLWGSLHKLEKFAEGEEVDRKSYSTTTWAYNKIQMPDAGEAVLNQSLGSLQVLEDYPTAGSQYYLSAPGAPEQIKQYFGVQQTLSSHRFWNKAGCYVSNGCPQSNILTTQIIYKRFLPSVSMLESMEDRLITTSRNYFHDFRSGKALKSRHVNSDNSSVVTEAIPAYYKYSPMLRLNTIAQDFALNRYKYSSSERTNFYQAEDPAKAISSEVTIWRPFHPDGWWSDRLPRGEVQAFRRFRTLKWRVNLNSDPRPNLALPNESCSETSTPTFSFVCNGEGTGYLPDWFVSDQTNRYSNFGLPTEVSDQRGINNSILYGHDRTLPVAHVSNTSFPNNPPDGKFQALYEGFEYLSDFQVPVTSFDQYGLFPGNSKAGNSSLEVRNTLGEGGMVCFYIGNLEAYKEYEASVWYFDATDGSSPSNGNATRPGIFLGVNQDGGCASENHPNGVGGSPPAQPGSWNFADRATGSRKWKRIKATIQAGQCQEPYGLMNSEVCLYSSKWVAGAPVLYDELRVKPGNSFMTTYSYDDKGRMIAHSDERETVTSFEYDALGNLTGIRNDAGVLLSEQSKSIGKR